MKYVLLCLLFLTAATSCDGDEKINCPYTKQGDQITLADGALARLAVVSDQRCPCDAVCVWEGYIGLTITVGSDTILGVGDVFGRQFTTDTTFVNNQYFTSRGDRVTLISYTEPENSCEGVVAGEDFCLELIVE